MTRAFKPLYYKIPRHIEPPDGWWQAAFANPPTPSEREGHPCGAHEMLMIVSYDITEPRRLRQVAKHCEDYGIRVQYSVFECSLEAGYFEEFWSGLMDLIDPKSDRVVAYRICATCAREIRNGGIMQNAEKEKAVCYVF